MDPTDPTKLVSVWTDHNKNRDAFSINGAYSTDGGTSWTPMPLATNLDIDPDSSATDPQPYNSSKDASVAIDRSHNVYVVFREVSSDGTSGEIVLQKFDFSKAIPALNPPLNAGAVGNTSKVVYQWTKAGDVAVEPMLAVDNNVATVTPGMVDSNGKPFVQDDQWAGNVYIAWATNDVLPNGVAANKFNTNIIRLIASSDGGDTFSSPTALSDRNSGERAAAPRLVVSQGTQVVGKKQTVAAGQVSVVWDGFQNTANNQTGSDEIIFDQQDNGAVSYDSSVTATVPAAATPPPAMPPGPTMIPIPVALTDTRFDVTKLTDLSIDLTIGGLDVKDITVSLVSPDGSKSIVLFGNGNVVGTNFGIDTAGAPGVTFIDSAARIISENKGSGTHIGIYRPTGGSLDTIFGGMALADVNGSWNLAITNANTTTAANVTATLHLTSGLKPGGGTDSFVASTPIRGALTAPTRSKPPPCPMSALGPRRRSPRTTPSALIASRRAESISPTPASKTSTSATPHTPR